LLIWAEKPVATRECRFKTKRNAHHRWEQLIYSESHSNLKRDTDGFDQQLNRSLQNTQKVTSTKPKRQTRTAKLNGHDPYAHLKDVLARLPTHKNNKIEELLPHCWQPLQP
jgi:hypothetical protein